jgi:hypothetical protein
LFHTSIVSAGRPLFTNRFWMHPVKNSPLTARAALC